MNKNECIEYCLNQMNLMWDGCHDYQERRDIYDACKAYCRKYGYIGGAFDQIWSAANRLREIRNGTYIPGLSM